MENMKPAPVTKGPQDAENLSVVGDTYRILITGKETDGAFAVIDMLIPPEIRAETFPAGLHRITRDEIFNQMTLSQEAQQNVALVKSLRAE